MHSIDGTVLTNFCYFLLLLHVLLFCCFSLMLYLWMRQCTNILKLIGLGFEPSWHWIRTQTEWTWLHPACSTVLGSCEYHCRHCWNM